MTAYVDPNHFAKQQACKASTAAAEFKEQVIRGLLPDEIRGDLPAVAKYINDNHMEWRILPPSSAEFPDEQIWMRGQHIGTIRTTFGQIGSSMDYEYRWEFIPA